MSDPGILSVYLSFFKISLFQLFNQYPSGKSLFFFLPLSSCFCFNFDDRFFFAIHGAFALT